MNLIWNKIVTFWHQFGMEKIPPGATDECIEDFELRYQVKLPPDLRDYFKAANGTGGLWDQNFNCFWSIEEVKPVHLELVPNSINQYHYPDQFSYPNCFVFADHCISCWLYAVRLTEDPLQMAPVYRVTGDTTPGEKLSESFLDFMQRYLENPDLIL
ncbi:MAG: SMI1/KNR4 family protein [Planctomycetota bacterium]|nr:MAG: SMI1/KNR4 family protein [Planctomycetota bacterium]